MGTELVRAEVEGDRIELRRQVACLRNRVVTYGHQKMRRGPAQSLQWCT